MNKSIGTLPSHRNMGSMACYPANELHIPWSELSWRKLPPTLATAHYSSPDNAIGLVAQRELNEYVKLG